MTRQPTPEQACQLLGELANISSNISLSTDLEWESKNKEIKDFFRPQHLKLAVWHEGGSYFIRHDFRLIEMLYHQSALIVCSLTCSIAAYLKQSQTRRLLVP